MASIVLCWSPIRPVALARADAGKDLLEHVRIDVRRGVLAWRLRRSAAALPRPIVVPAAARHHGSVSRAGSNPRCVCRAAGRRSAYGYGCGRRGRGLGDRLRELLSTIRDWREHVDGGRTMAEGITAGHCGICDYEFPDPVEAAAQPADTPCPKCQGHAPVFTVTASDSAKFHEFAQVKGRRPGQRRPHFEVQAGEELYKKEARFVGKYRCIDRERNEYDEKVVDPDTGEVLHECHESLTDHFGHGSARSAGSMSAAEENSPPGRSPDAKG